jgi:hypothetical protein
MTNMPADDGDLYGGNDPGKVDPGADTGMFRAYVEQPGEPTEPAPGRTLIIGLVVAVVVLAVLVLVLAVA